MTNIINVFVVDDDASVRDSLRMMLDAAGCNVATFSSADGFLSICDPETEGCIILDVNIPGMDGPALQDEMNRRGIRMPVIFLTGQGTVPISARAFKAGAMDFLTKPVNGMELISCVNQALQKCSILHKQILEAKSIQSRLAHLTEREKTVMMLMVEGRTSKGIAELLEISFRTVESHRLRIMQKTGASNLLELARICQSTMQGSNNWER